MSKSVVIGVVGDFMLDEWYDAQEYIASKEADIVDLINPTYTDNLGGAGNVAANVVGLGAQCVAYGVVGNDFAGKRVRALLDRLGITDNLVSGRRTTREVRYQKDGETLLQVTHRDIDYTRTAIHDALDDALWRDIGFLDGIILSDYNIGVLVPSLLWRTIQRARAHDVVVTADPMHRSINAYSGVSLLKANKHELAVLTDTTDIVAGAKELQAKLNIDDVLITLGADGVYVASQDTFVQAPEVVVDCVAGAGDTMIASLTLDRICGVHIMEAVEHAMRLAAKVVQLPRVQAVKE